MMQKEAEQRGTAKREDKIFLEGKFFNMFTGCGTDLFRVLSSKKRSSRRS